MTRVSSVRFMVAILLLLSVTFGLRVPLAYTAGTVNTCDEASLDTALAGGGIITFGCSGTITVTATKTISANTVLDGSGQNVTLSGGGTVTVFYVNIGATLELRSLTVSGGFAVGSGGGGVNRGTLNIIDSTFSNNSSGNNGGGVVNEGIMTVTNSTFSGNSSEFGAGMINSFNATLTISNSTFSNNLATVGGGIFNYSSTLTINDSTFSNNSAEHGGGVSNNIISTLNIDHSIFSGNSATVGGGGIENRGTTNITNSTFFDNTSINGGNLYNYSDTLNTANSNFANGSCTGIISDGGGNGAFNAPGCPGELLATMPALASTPAPDQCQETLDPTFAAPVGWYCQVLMRDNVWVGYAGTIPSELTEAGVIIAVDVIYYDFAGHAAQQVDGTHQVCLRGEGRFIFLSSAQSPRQIVELNSVSEGGYTCAWVSTSGTAVLIHN